MLGRFSRHRSGTAAIEFCFVAPVLLMLYAGITEFGSILKAYYQTNRLASQYAAAWADCSDYNPVGNCNTELTTYTTASAFANIAPALTSSNITLQMFHFQMNGTTPKAPLYVYPAGATMTADQISKAQSAGIPDKDYAVLVTVRYQHTLTFFQTFMTPWLPASVLTPSYTIVALKSS